MGLALAGATIGTLGLAPAASAVCGTVIPDPTPPGFHDVQCNYGSGAHETWSVPANIAEPEFVLKGADDPAGGTGGQLRVKLPVVAGETLELDLGGEGAESTVSRNGEALLVAAGGDGKEANFISPEAKTIEVDEPGQPLGTGAGDGSVYIQWYDRREPLSGPFPDVIFDFFSGENIGFAYTGAAQAWTVPEGVKRATFELWGGPGGSGEPRGHIVAGYDVAPGETFNVWVGGPGGDTILTAGSVWPSVLAIASGGDTERPNYVFPPASPAESIWEGGVAGSQAADGRAAVHFQPRREEVMPRPPKPKERQQCVVPGLRGMKPAAARRALAEANCTLGTIVRRPSRRGMRGRIVRQAVPPGTVAADGSAVPATVGKRP